MSGPSLLQDNYSSSSLQQGRLVSLVICVLSGGVRSAARAILSIVISPEDSAVWCGYLQRREGEGRCTHMR